ncbi:MAG: anthranilate synthase component 1 [Candidatus Diapherotrites archaeon]|uniref:anthranilate synthase n=1 Tax=Candidatus Iainarchaeum sp. TaxID=3101447 RepID=A0A938YNP1_9ARCH|nr:anthranilate synthase component 1 [Candidatus Diapherotrites archaeon]
MDFKEQIGKACCGQIVPVYTVHNEAVDPISFFSLLSEKGEKENCILLESADVMKRYGEKSIGCSSPCLKAKGKGNRFEITALNETGERFIEFIKGDFGFCKKLSVEKGMIEGEIEKRKEIVSEEERLRTVTLADALRTIAFKFKPAAKPFPVFGGLFGAISYDFIDQFEQLPKNKQDLNNDPDFEMLFCDSLFLIDHADKKTVFIANALLTGKGDEKEAERCAAIIESYENALSKIKSTQVKKTPNPKKANLKISSDTSRQEFISIVKKCKQRIVAGDVFQIVPSRTTVVETGVSPLAVYKQLRSLNPSPYMFFMRTNEGVLLGSSPETFLKVEGNASKKIEIRPIAGTKPRGLVNGKIDLELDSRFENELKTDEKELAEHTMLVDLARNDAARVSVPGTRFVDRPHYIEKYSHVMHLVSNVTGTLKPGLDALHAYLASMNMGTLTGAPKVKAMELLRKFEKAKRGYYGGSIGYLTPSGDFDSAIVIRSIRMKKGRAFVRAGAGIVFDSLPEKEFEETERKARACIKAIELAAGVPE